MSEEIWKPVVGFEGHYKVSDYGRVQTLKTRIYYSGGISLIVPIKKESGHLCVGLWKDNKEYRRYIHRLVLEAFVGPAPLGTECRHYPNQDPSDNRLCNLSWASHTINVNDRVENDTHRRGERCNTSVLTEEDILEIRKMYKNGDYQKYIAEKYGVTQTCISLIIRRQRWKHI